MKFKQTLIAALVALAPMSAMAAGSVDVFYVNQDVDIEGAGKDDGDGFGIRAQADLGQGISLSAGANGGDIALTDATLTAATAGQSCPPTPMIVGMKGGAVWAVPEVRSTAKAYSFQAKIRQKIAVEAMPVAACGRTTL